MIKAELAGSMTLATGVVVRPGSPLLLMVRVGPDYIAYPLSPDAARGLAATLLDEADTADGPLRRRLARDAAVSG